MSREEKVKWERKYSQADFADFRQPSALLRRFIDELPPGKALDLGCGTGRNALFLAEKGYDVTAVDISPKGLELAEQKAREKGLTVNWIAADLDRYRIQGPYDVILNFFYVNRSIIPHIVSALSRGGILLYESHVVPPVPDEGPRTRRFRFESGELPELFKALTIIHYQEHWLDEEGERHSWGASLVAKKEW